MYDHVLVGTDGSPTATRAVEAAARLAHAYQAKLTIVHAFRPRRPSVVADASFVPTEDAWRLTPGGAAESLVDRAADHAQLTACGGLHIETRVEPGSAASVLRALARELEPDVIVVGNADVYRPRLRRSIGQALSRRVTSDVVIIDTASRRSTAA